MSLLRFLWELGHEIWHERRQAKARQRAAEAWANTPGPRRLCPNCSEIAYVPRQASCTKCGARL